MFHFHFSFLNITGWDLVKHDLVLLVNHFDNGTFRVPKLNHAMVCLLPKEKSATCIRKYRPISLLNFRTPIWSGQERLFFSICL